MREKTFTKKHVTFLILIFNIFIYKDEYAENQLKCAMKYKGDMKEIWYNEVKYSSRGITVDGYDGIENSLEILKKLLHPVLQ